MSLAALGFTWLLLQVGTPDRLELRGAGTALVGVDVLDVRTGELSPGRTLLVEGGVVTREGPAAEVEVPSGWRRVEGRGRVLLPGLIDSGVRVADGAELVLYLAHGVTTIRVLEGSRATLDLRARVEAGLLPGPRMIVGSPPIEEASAGRGPRELVERLAAEGYDFLTVGDSLRPDTYALLCREARRAGLELAGPRPALVGAAALSSGAQNGIHRIESLLLREGAAPPRPIDDASLTEWAEQLRAADVTVTTGLAGFRGLVRQARGGPGADDDPELRWVDPASRALWARSGAGPRHHDREELLPRLEQSLARQLGIASALHAAGVTLLPASNALSAHTVPGVSLHEELALWVRAGIELMDALRAATRGSGRLGPGEIPAISSGARADFLLVEGDPRSDLACLERPAGVLVAGTWSSRESLDRELHELSRLHEQEAPFVAALLEPAPGLRAFSGSYGQGRAGERPHPGVREELAERMCRLLLRWRGPGDARELAEYCVRTWPRAWWSHLHLAEALSRQDERRRPRELVARSLELRPGYSPAEELLSRLGGRVTSDGEPEPCSPATPSREGSTAGPWDRFRGGNGSGVCEVGPLPEVLDPEGNMAWSTPLPGGYSSPVLDEARVFVTAVRGVRMFTFCLCQDRGEILWSAQAPAKLEKPLRGRSNPATPSPACDGENVYVFFEQSGLIAYDIHGAERWRLPLGPFLAPYGHGSSPILAGDRVLLLCDHDGDSFLIAVDRERGELRWRTERPLASHSFSTPVIYEPRDGPGEVICSGPYEVAGYSLETGERLWWARGMAALANTVPSIVGDVLYVHTWTVTPANMGADRFEGTWSQALGVYDRDGDERISREELEELGLEYAWELYDVDADGQLNEREWQMALAHRTSRNGIHAIRLGGRGDVSESHVLWTNRKGLPNHSSPLLYRGVLYMLKDGGIFSALDPETGRVLKAARIGSPTEAYYASPVAGDGKIYVASDQGRVTILRAGADWQVLSSCELGEEIIATPALSDGLVVVRSKNSLRAFRAEAR